MRRSQPRRDGPNRPFVFSVGRQPNLRAGFPATPRRDCGTTLERLTALLVAMSFLLPLRRGPATVRRQRPASKPSPRGAALTRRPCQLFHSPARPMLAVGHEGCSPNIACQHRASSAPGTPTYDMSHRVPSPTPCASISGTPPICSTLSWRSSEPPRAWFFRLVVAPIARGCCRRCCC